MTPSQAKILLYAVEGTSDIGMELIHDRNRVFSVHAQRLLDEEQMLIKALEINRQDQERFANWIPKPQHPQQTLRQAIQQGPQAQIGRQHEEAKDQRQAAGNSGQRP